MDVMKDEAEVANREQDLTIAKTTLQFQELLIKNALTKNLDDPILEAMPVRPTDQSSMVQMNGQGPTEDLIAQALRTAPELLESDIDLDNRHISRDARGMRCCRSVGDGVLRRNRVGGFKILSPGDVSPRQ
jgi:hypothetical protein